VISRQLRILLLLMISVDFSV